MTLQIAEPQTKRWTREDYYRLAEAGWFRGQRVQLIDGEIIEMPPQGHPHAKALSIIDRWLHGAFGDDYVIRIQMPLNVLKRSDPEPDAAVVRGPIGKYSDHPQTALFIIEVADSSLPLDRNKANLYAAAGVEEYWIVDVQHRIVEVYRDPIADRSAPRGYRYSTHAVAKKNESIACLEKPKVKFRVATLFS